MGDPFELLNAGRGSDPLDDARRHAAALEAGIRSLEKEPASSDALDEVYRSAHTLRSEAAPSGLPGIARICRLVQEVVLGVRSGRLAASPALVAILGSAAQSVQAGVGARARGARPLPDPEPVAASLERLLHAPAGAAEDGGEQPGEGARPAGIAAGVLNGLDARKLEEAAAASRDSASLASGLARVWETVDELRAAARSTAERHDRALEEILADLPGRLAAVAAGEPVTAVARDLAGRISSLGALAPGFDDSFSIASVRLRDAARGCLRAAEDCRDTVACVAMVPLQPALARFPRFVWTVSGKLGRTVEVKVRPGDAVIHAALLPPFLAALKRCARLAIAQGIERPRERKRKKKKPAARMELSFSSDDEGVSVVLSDDGAGLPADAVTGAVPRIRGGVEKLGGSLAVSSRKGRGTTFSLRMADPSGAYARAFPCLIARAGESTFAIRQSEVEECVTLKASAVRGSGNRESVARGGHALHVVRPGGGTGRAAAIVRAGERKAVLLFDSLEGSESVTPSPMRGRDAGAPGIAGACVLSNGSLAMVVDVPGVIAAIPSPKKKRSKKQKSRKR